MKSSICCAVWLAVSGVVAVHQPSVLDPDHRVIYQGIYRNDIEAFLGIHYGQDTSGKNRFRPPRAFVPKPGSTVNATADGRACPQDPAGLFIPGTTFISEDCLNLNVVRPHGTTAGDRLPVMVWIYGGSFWAGHAQDLYSLPDFLIAQSVANKLPVIHVAMNYRMGMFGFAQSDALKAERSENAGLRDQRLALEWVQENIKHFGGDPSKVTVHGQSSGGLAVGLHILAYGGKKPIPFQQGVCESQALELALTSNFTLGAMKAVVDHLGIKSDLQSAETITTLQNLDMEILLNATIATYTNDIMDGDDWLPTVDGDFIPEAPSKLLREHRFGKANVIIGWCDGDMNLLTDYTIKTAQDSRRVLGNYIPYVTKANLDKLLGLYPISEFHNGTELSAEFYRTSRIKRDLMMACQAMHVGQEIAAAGNQVYFYHWNQSFSDKLFHALGQPEGLGVPHTSELPYLFGNPDLWTFPGVPSFVTPSDYRLADRGSRSFSTFASTGKPGLPGHNTFQGWMPAIGKGPDNINIFVAGGPHEGSTPWDGPGSLPQLREQKLRERCGFINSPEMIEQLRY